MSLIVAIEQGKTKTECVVFDIREQRVLERSHVDIHQLPSQNNNHREYDPDEIYDSVIECINNCLANIEGFKESEVMSVGITAQPGTVVAWDKFTGQPLANAICGDDTRTNDLVNDYIRKTPECNMYHYFEQTGLPLNGFFSAFKFRWLLSNVAAVKRSAADNRLALGTMDSWLVFRLTLGARFVTEVTSASKTLLMNIETFQYDPIMLEFFDIPERCLPEILNTAQEVGPITDDRSGLRCVFINSIMCNMQADIVGESFDGDFHSESMLKARIGARGSFLWSIGAKRPFCSTGLLTSVIYRINDGQQSYAIEGIAASAGSAIDWMIDNLGLCPADYEEFERIVSETYCEWKTNGKDDIVYFVPSFTGLYSPYWRQDSRSIIMGFDKKCTKDDVLLAGLRASAYQMQDIIEAGLECLQVSRPCILMVNGGVAHSNTFLQSLADITGIQVSRSHNLGIMPCLGVAIMSCVSKGIDYLPLLNIRNLSNGECVLTGVTTFLPSIPAEQRSRIYKKWEGSVQRSFQWKPLKNFHDCKCKREYKSKDCNICTYSKGFLCAIGGSALGFMIVKKGLL